MPPIEKFSPSQLHADCKLNLAARCYMQMTPDWSHYCLPSYACQSSLEAQSAGLSFRLKRLVNTHDHKLLESRLLGWI